MQSKSKIRSLHTRRELIAIPAWVIPGESNKHKLITDSDNTRAPFGGAVKKTENREQRRDGESEEGGRRWPLIAH
jgi:hypothetical protein